MLWGLSKSFSLSFTPLYGTIWGDIPDFRNSGYIFQLLIKMSSFLREQILIVYINKLSSFFPKIISVYSSCSKLNTPFIHWKQLHSTLNLHFKVEWEKNCNRYYLKLNLYQVFLEFTPNYICLLPAIFL